MKKLNDIDIKVNVIAFIVSSAIYLINEITKSYHSNNLIYSLMNWYFNDIVCGFLLCSVINLILLLNGFKPAKSWVLIMIVFVSGLIFEFIAPIYKLSSVPDVVDIFCYILGSIIFIFYCRKSTLDN